MANQAERKIELLRERVEDIVTGFHPISRKPLSESSDLKDPDVIRLLVQILVELSQQTPRSKYIDFERSAKQRKNEIEGNPLNHNTRWQNAEVKELCILYDQGRDVVTLAETFQRTVGSVIGKLRYAGVLSDEEASELYLEVTKPEGPNSTE